MKWSELPKGTKVIYSELKGWRTVGIHRAVVLGTSLYKVAIEYTDNDGNKVTRNVKKSSLQLGWEHQS